MNRDQIEQIARAKFANEHPDADLRDLDIAQQPDGSWCYRYRLADGTVGEYFVGAASWGFGE